MIRLQSSVYQRSEFQWRIGDIEGFRAILKPFQSVYLSSGLVSALICYIWHLHKRREIWDRLE